MNDIIVPDQSSNKDKSCSKFQVERDIAYIIRLLKETVRSGLRPLCVSI